MSNYQDEYFRKKSLLKQTGVRDESGAIPESAYGAGGREAYESKLLSRNVAPEGSAPAVADPTAAQGLKEGGQAMGAQTASAGAQQGDYATMAGGAMMMSGNPYLMGAGLGVTVLAAGEKNKRANEEAQRQAYNERIMNRQKMMQQIASQGIQ